MLNDSLSAGAEDIFSKSAFVARLALMLVKWPVRLEDTLALVLSDKLFAELAFPRASTASPGLTVPEALLCVSGDEPLLACQA